MWSLGNNLFGISTAVSSSMRAFQIGLMLALAVCTASADTVSLSLTNANLTGQPGQVLLFSGVFVNDTADEVFINSSDLNAPDADFGDDFVVNDLFDSITLGAYATSSVVDLFNVVIPEDFTAFDSYSGTYASLGGATLDDQSLLMSPPGVDFSFTVEPADSGLVPEPGSLWLALAALPLWYFASDKGPLTCRLSRTPTKFRPNIPHKAE